MNIRKGLLPLIFSLLSVLLHSGFTSAADTALESEALQANLEKSLEGIQTLTDLIDNPEKLNAYYIAINDFYQGKIKRNIFDIIIAQMRKMNLENPELGRRLLRLSPSQPVYSIRSDVKTYGRNLESFFWNEQKLRIFGSPPTEQEYRKSLTELAQIENQINEFEIKIKNLGKKQVAAQRAAFFKDIKEKYNATFRSAAAHTYYSKIEPFQINDPDLLLYALDSTFKAEVTANPAIPSRLKALVVAVVPRTSDLLENKQMLPIAFRPSSKGEAPVEPMSATVFTFTNFKRPLHAAWKGIWLMECVGGGTDKPTPRRWATVALNDVHNYIVSKNGSFVGFIQELGQRKKGQRSIYYATEFGAPNLKESVLQFDQGSILPVKTPLIDLWLKVAPKGALRLKSESEAINNAKVIPALQKSNAWSWRPSLGDARNFELVDQKFADFIITSSAQNGFHPSYDYGKGIISDSTVPDAKTLSALTSARIRPDQYEKMIRNGKISTTDLEQWSLRLNIPLTREMLSVYFASRYEQAVPMSADDFLKGLKKYGDQLPRAEVEKIFLKMGQDSRIDASTRSSLLYESLKSLPGFKSEIITSLLTFAESESTPWIVKSLILIDLKGPESVLAPEALRDILSPQLFELFKETYRIPSYGRRTQAEEMMGQELFKRKYLPSFEAVDLKVGLVRSLAHKSLLLEILNETLAGRASEMPHLFNIIVKYWRDYTSQDQKTILDTFERAGQREKFLEATLRSKYSHIFSFNSQSAGFNALAEHLLSKRDPELFDRTFNHSGGLILNSREPVALLYQRMLASKDPQLYRLLMLPSVTQLALRLSLTNPEIQPYLQLLRNQPAGELAKTEVQEGLSGELLKVYSQAPNHSKPVQTASDAPDMKRAGTTIPAVAKAREPGPREPDRLLTRETLKNLEPELTLKLRKMLESDEPGLIHAAQMEVEKMLHWGVRFDATSDAIASVFLYDVNSANYAQRAHRILALLEITGKFPLIRDDIYEMSRTRGSWVFQLNRFQPFKPQYESLLKGRPSIQSFTCRKIHSI